MIDIFEQEVIQVLKDQDIHTKKYFGEFSNPQNIQVNLNDLPLIYLDYTGSEPEGRIKEEHTFYLYIAHISYSKNEVTRSNKHYELYELFDKIKKTINLKSFENSDPIRWGKKTKIYDAVTDKGYLTVFTQSFTTIL